MAALFNIIRACTYALVILFTCICLAMAGHFQSVLIASDLTRFVPFAIFVCSASMFIFLILLSFSFFLRERNPISTRIELACLALAGTFWLVLGVYLTTSESQSADVECFASESSTQPLDDDAANFHTDQYQAMYRVLMVFSLMNATIILLSCLALLFLAIRRHRNGDNHMWHGPVTSCAWFNSYSEGKHARHNSNGSSILPITANHNKGSTSRQTSGRRQGGNSRYRQDPYSEKPLPRTKKSWYTTEDLNHGTLMYPKTAHGSR
ncbi:hypothetical protein AMATHDRAFT_139379 [Amanita thiersii Skay4041]|uniref:MARVEL domain-containing protein n=1 Tax=Amanita thiersii Skay4041 TaxID=703135 RepID=A0A2A9NWM5_9AGAR|nr:hypothetical protein AMATHDRAFT_139379 [Amanita thiersii Skay4041]